MRARSTQQPAPQEEGQPPPPGGGSGHGDVAAPPPRALVHEPDLLLALLVAAVVLVGSGVTLEDDWEISLVAGTVEPWLPGPVGLAAAAGRIPPPDLPADRAADGARASPRRLDRLPGARATARSRCRSACSSRSTPSPCSAGRWSCSIAAAVYVVVVTAAALTGWLPLTDDQFYIYLVSVVATVMLGYGVALSRARATVAEQRAAAVSRDHERADAGSGRAGTGADRARGPRHRRPRRERDRRAGGGRPARLCRPPEKAADALASIEAVGRDALDGLRRLVGLLRTGLDDEDRSPQPSLERLPVLLAQVERAGLPVELTVTRHARPAAGDGGAQRLPDRAGGADQQPQARRPDPGGGHCSGTAGRRCGWRCATRAGHASTTPASAGYGLISMQQRAAMLGGVLVAGPGGGRAASGSRPACRRGRCATT